jgi:hypothetical protein
MRQNTIAIRARRSCSRSGPTSAAPKYPKVSWQQLDLLPGARSSPRSRVPSFQTCSSDHNNRDLRRRCCKKSRQSRRCRRVADEGAGPGHIIGKCVQHAGDVSSLKCCIKPLHQPQILLLAHWSVLCRVAIAALLLAARLTACSVAIAWAHHPRLAHSNEEHDTALRRQALCGGPSWGTRRADRRGALPCPPLPSHL